MGFLSISFDYRIRIWSGRGSCVVLFPQRTRFISIALIIEAHFGNFPVGLTPTRILWRSNLIQILLSWIWAPVRLSPIFLQIWYHSDQGSFENCYSHSWVCIHTSCIPSCRYFCTHVSKKPSFMFSNKKKHLFILLHINPTTFFTSVHSMFCFIA